MTSSCLFWYRVELSFLRASVNVIFFNSSHTTRKNSVSVSHTSWKDKLVKIRICNFSAWKSYANNYLLKWRDISRILSRHENNKSTRYRCFPVIYRSSGISFQRYMAPAEHRHNIISSICQRAYYVIKKYR